MSSSPSSGSSVSSGSTNLYNGWMTAYAHEALKDLFPFKDEPARHLDPKGIETLLQWLGSYLNTVDGWKITKPDDFITLIEKMLTYVQKLWDKQDPKAEDGVSLLEFEKWYAVLLGAMKAKSPFSSYAADFASCLSQLKHLRSLREASNALTQMSEALNHLKSIVSREAYDVVHGGINDLQSSCKKRNPNGGEKIDYELIKKVKTYVKNADSCWSSLILGTKSPGDLLKWTDKAAIGSITAVVGIFAFGGLIVLGAYAAIVAIVPTLIAPYFPVPNLEPTTLADVKNLTAGLQAVVPILTGLGLTASILAKKAWNSLSYLESKMLAVNFAKRRIEKG